MGLSERWRTPRGLLAIHPQFIPIIFWGAGALIPPAPSPHHHNQGQRGQPAALPARPPVLLGEVVSVQPQPLTSPSLPTKPSPAKLSSSPPLSTRPSPLRTRLNQLRECRVLLREGQALGKHKEPPAPADSQLFRSEIALRFFFLIIFSGR